MRKSNRIKYFVFALSCFTVMLSALSILTSGFSGSALATDDKNGTFSSYLTTFAVSEKQFIRLNGEKGIRYFSTVSVDEYEELTKEEGEYNDFEFGYFFMPDYYEDIIGEVNFESTFGASAVYTWEDNERQSDALKRYPVIHNNTIQPVLEVVDDSEQYVLNASVVDMYDENLTKTYICRTYVKAVEKATGEEVYAFAEPAEGSSFINTCIRFINGATETSEIEEAEAYLNSYIEWFKSENDDKEPTYSYKVLYCEGDSVIKTDVIEGNKLNVEIDVSESLEMPELYWFDNSRTADNILTGRIFANNDLTLKVYVKQLTKESLVGATNLNGDYYYFDKSSGSDYTLDISKTLTGVGQVKIGETVIDSSSYTVNGSTITIVKSAVSGIACGDYTLSVIDKGTLYSGEITVADYVISNTEELKAVLIEQQKGNSYIVFDQDINEVGIYPACYTGGQEFWFQGVIDGKGHKIDGAYIQGNGLLYQIGPSGVVKNLAITNAVVNKVNSAILTHVNNGLVSNVYIEGDACGTAVADALTSTGRIENTVVDVNYIGNNPSYSSGYGVLVAGNSNNNKNNVTNTYGLSDTFINMSVDGGWAPVRAGFAGNIASLKSFLNGSFNETFAKYWGFDGDGNITFGSNMVERRAKDYTVGATALNYQAGKHELFSFAKTYDITADYESAYIADAKYKVQLSNDIDNIYGVMIGSTHVGEFVLDTEKDILSIPVNAISKFNCGEYNLVIITGDANYCGKVVISDYVITSSSGLVNVLPAISMGAKCVVLDKDIDCTGVTYQDNKAGGGDDWFSGTLDGRGYALINLTLSGYGLFGQIGPVGTVKNLAIIDGNNTSNGLGGTLITGWNYGTIDNVYVSGNSSGRSGIAITSANQSSYKSKVSNCIANVHGTHNDGYWFTVGGVVVGTTSAEVTNCYGISDNFKKGIYLNNETGNAYMTNFYNNTSDFKTAIGGVVPSGFNEYWTIKDGNLYFGNNLII